ncbi:MAG: putative glycoside hydrolase [Patescibacteria group bacterium]
MEHTGYAKIGAFIAAAIIVTGAAIVMYPSRHPAPQPPTLLAETAIAQPAAPVITHVATPSSVKAIYVSSWSAGTAASMVRINKLLDAGMLNAVVIDVKDATGRLSYMPLDPELLASGVGTRRIAHLAPLIKSLHDRNIYVIGRVTVFQDSYRASIKPEEALHDLEGNVWKDSKGLLWLRPNNPEVWQYVESIGKDAYAQGFDEINVDYVRFPSDGNLKNIDVSSFTDSKQNMIAAFFAHLDATLRKESHIPLSADIFGLTLSAKDDLGIGQKLELIAPHVDYVCPMIYPSHFSSGSYGFKNPADHPYEVIEHSMSDGLAKLKAAGLPATALRPWLQDFNLGAIYTADKVQAQIDAVHAVGLQSWLMWDAKNVYTSSVYK